MTEPHCKDCPDARECSTLGHCTREPSTPSADVLTREQIATLGKLLDLMDDLTEVRTPAEWQMKLYEFMDTMESDVRDALRALLRSLAQGDVVMVPRAALEALKHDLALTERINRVNWFDTIKHWLAAEQPERKDQP